MESFFKKGTLLFVAAMALCAPATPSPASAASWSVIGTEHTLDSPNFGFTATTVVGPVDSSCSSSQVTAHVASSTALEFTSALFGGPCTTVFNGTEVCSATNVATSLPWTATVPTTANVQLHTVRLDQVLDQSSAGTCPAFAVGLNLTITGTATNGTWSNTNREITYTDAPGLVMHSPLGNNQPVTLRGTLRDTQQTLTVRGALYSLPRSLPPQSPSLGITPGPLLALGMVAMLAFALWSRRGGPAAFGWSVNPVAGADPDRRDGR